MSEFVVLLASLAQDLQVSVATEPVSGQLRRVRLIVTNVGHLPTYVTATSRSRVWNGPVRVVARPLDCRIVEGAPTRELGHLPGWGRGDEEEANGPFFQRSQGIVDAQLTWIIEGPGTLEIEVGSPRLGWRTLTAGRSP